MKDVPVVVWWQEHLKDGYEAHAKVCDTVEDAVKTANEIKGSFFGCNTTVRLFELGAEIPLRFREVEEPQPSKKSIVVELEKP